MSDFHALTISEVKKVTPNAVAISFSIPEKLQPAFTFKAGQYITIKHTLDGVEVRRAYSICTSPNSGKLTVGIKKVKDGTFSEFANSVLKAGDTLEVMPPEGTFVYESDIPGNYLSFSAGSGITPVLSIVKAVLEGDDESTFSLCYGNRSLEETMFVDELMKLKEAYPDRFFLQYIFSRKKEFTGIFGRIDKSTVNYLLKNQFSERTYDAVYLCGPEEMIHTVSDLLQSKGMSKSQIKFELFTTSVEGSLEESHDGMTKVTVVLDDETETFLMPQSSSVLEAALKHGIDAPFSCQGGICSTCIAKMSEGKAEMRKNQILTDDEIADGLILTCQAHPSTPTLHIDYDDV